MDEQATTVAPAGDSGADDDAITLDDEDKAALPEEKQDETTAETPAKEQTEEPEGDDEKPSIPDWAADPKLVSFAKGQGIEDVAELSKRELGLLKSAYDNKAGLDRHKSLDKSITQSSAKSDVGVETDPKEARIRALELKDSVNTFFNREDVDKEMRPKMGEFAEANPNISYLVETGYLSIEDLYNMVRGSDPNLLENAAKQGGKEALKKVAQRQQAKAVPGAATNSQLTDNEPEDAFLKAFDAS